MGVCMEMSMLVIGEDLTLGILQIGIRQRCLRTHLDDRTYRLSLQQSSDQSRAERCRPILRGNGTRRPRLRSRLHLCAGLPEVNLPLHLQGG